MQKKLVNCGALPCLAHIELCGAETCPPPPRAPPPISQAKWDSVYLQLSRRINLDSVHLQTAQSRTCSYKTLYVHVVLYISSSNTLFWNTPKWFIRIVLIVVIFLG
jgi:hypothetical protein